MITTNFIICLLGTLLGFVMLIKHLKIFSTDKTPTVDAWLVAVGTLAWTLFLYSAHDSLTVNTAWVDEATDQYTATVLARALFLAYWAGDMLKIKRHCLTLLKRKKRFG